MVPCPLPVSSIPRNYESNVFPLTAPVSCPFILYAFQFSSRGHSFSSVPRFGSASLFRRGYFRTNRSVPWRTTMRVGFIENEAIEHFSFEGNPFVAVFYNRTENVEFIFSFTLDFDRQHFPYRYSVSYHCILLLVSEENDSIISVAKKTLITLVRWFN